MKKFTFALLALALSAPAMARDLTCDPGQNDEFAVSVDGGKIAVSQDGGELGAEYTADPSKDTASYAAFKIVPRDQDGEQPAEMKIAKALLDGSAAAGNAWLAPGILGGSFHCKASRE